MGTRSRIGLRRDDGSVASIYCHWDGYIEHNGMILLKHYTDPIKVARLISFGDMSTLHQYVSPEDVPNLMPQKTTSDIKKYPADWKHSHDTPAQDVCVFYGRDRGEKDVDFKVTDDKGFQSLFQSFNYIFEHGTWMWTKNGTKWYTLKESQSRAKKIPT